jgi:hypothetical protein
MSPDNQFMRVFSLALAAERNLEPIERVRFLLDVADLVSPALQSVPATLHVAKESIAYARQWKPLGEISANNLYSFANKANQTGLAFEETNATTPSEVSAVISITSAYYYAIWCAYVSEGVVEMPQDVEAVPDEGFHATLRYAIDSGAVQEKSLCEVLQQYYG